jgi:predicted aldo/keto reductase-like oxidoreductase
MAKDEPIRAPIRNQRAPMQYRRFGKTERELSVITLGGMRYVHGWEGKRTDLPQDSIDNCRRCTELALDAGINHIETAFGYGKSEHLYGKVLSEELNVPRSRYHLMTKGRPTSGNDQRKLIDKQLDALRTDHFDFYAWHGVNNQHDFDTMMAKDGPVEALLDLKRQGVIGHVGFSTHAPLDIILSALDTDCFDFVNLHYYYFRQRNEPAVRLAAKKDMGVFIISPNDKGGRLYKPSKLVADATAPLTPIQWNARFCLRTPDVHTLSFGMTAPAHFDEMRGIFPVSAPLSPSDQAALERLDARLDAVPGGRYEGWEHERHDSGINIPEALRLRRLWLGYDMIDFARYRYNMFGQDDWFPGVKCTEEVLAKLDASQFPRDVDVKALLREAHEKLSTTDQPETGH